MRPKRARTVRSASASCAACATSAVNRSTLAAASSSAASCAAFSSCGERLSNASLTSRRRDAMCAASSRPMPLAPPVIRYAPPSRRTSSRATSGSAAKPGASRRAPASAMLLGSSGGAPGGVAGSDDSSARNASIVASLASSISMWRHTMRGYSQRTALSKPAGAAAAHASSVRAERAPFVTSDTRKSAGCAPSACSSAASPANARSTSVCAQP